MTNQLLLTDKTEKDNSIKEDVVHKLRR